MANEKLIKHAKEEGYCCMWAFLEANRTVHTSVLVKLAKEAGFNITARAIRHQRRAYRRGQTKCQELPNCLKKKIKAGQTTS